MVAIAGVGWRLAPCLVRLIDETDRLFPNRSTASDGSVGDTAHSARTSDHNPDSGYVRAVDVTDDDANGCDVGLLAAHLVASRDPRVKYLIHKGTIWKSYASNGLVAWTPQVYTGTNAHLHHLHVSIRDGQENASGAWWPQSNPIPPPPAEPTPQELEAMGMFFAKQANTSEVFLFEPERFTHMKKRLDVNEIAKAAGIPNEEAVVGMATWEVLTKGRLKFL